ncbi:YheT family hydrolase [Nafulsella turpanensis]|uniref:YheT family hydrolase n=1 Tax=Nafulsella turpanensis TaxID=1265690 RepID=UPI0004756C06|nr:alpha/beta fold hydrolase [Nafulsella turpanensis]
MPLIKSSSYTERPFYLFNPHLETIVPSALRRVKIPPYIRERITTPDDDFLDLDWLQGGHDQLVILSHGLEGDTSRPYIQGMAKAFAQNGWDVLAWNCRTCSGELNRAQRMYHHGVSDDLDAVVQYALKENYKKLVLVGFSMGGSITLKYLGTHGKQLPEVLSRAIVFSVPCDLGGSARALSEKGNAFYRKRFLRKLGKKIKAKANQMPGLIDCEGYEKIEHFPEFDGRFTAPLHGFKDADDFYQQASANRYIPAIRVPTLIVNAKNDPMLPESCYPVELARDHPFVYLEVPEKGGHVGFSLAGQSMNWAERRALEFASAPAVPEQQ